MADHDAQSAVICRGVVKSFGEGDGKVMALRGVDLDVKRGELMMLVGPSGCGKTTLISIIAGILRADGGTCEVLGASFTQMKPADAVTFRGKNIGFIFQTFNLLPALSVTENVAVPLIINGTPRLKAMRQAKDLLGEVGLGNRVNAMPSDLSGGQQQRVAIARALVHGPGLLVCDEPTSALDHTTGAHIMELMRRTVHERGSTLIIVTHDNRIFQYADRVAHMDDGVVVHVGEEKEGANR